MTFNEEAWFHATRVLESEGYTAWVRWMMAHTDPTWLNGLASDITHQATAGRKT